MLYRQAQTFRNSPAAILGIEEPWIAYQVDSAVFALGAYVEAKASERHKDGKPKWTIEEILDGQAVKRRGTFQQLLAVFGSAAAPAGSRDTAPAGKAET